MGESRSGPPDKPVVLFDFDPSRSQAVPLRLLESWKGYLMADGLESYGAITFKEGVTRLGCLHRHPLVDPCCFGGAVDDLIELTRAKRLDRIQAWEQPAAIASLFFHRGLR